MGPGLFPVLSTSKKVLHITPGILALQTGALPVKTYLLVLSCCSVYVEIGSIVCGLARQIMGRPAAFGGQRWRKKDLANADIPELTRPFCIRFCCFRAPSSPRRRGSRRLQDLVAARMVTAGAESATGTVAAFFARL